MLTGMHIRRPLVRGRFRLSTRSWGISPRRRITTAITERIHKAVAQAVQLALFHLDFGSYQLPAKFNRTKRRKKQSRTERLRRRGKQYRLAMRTRTAPRVVEFRHRASVEDDVNTFTWAKSAQRMLHYHLLMESLDALKAHIHARSVRAAEIWRWIARRGNNEPFAFDTCVRMAAALDPDYSGCDPDTLRNALERILRKTYGVQLPHADVLRAGIKDAEEGNPDAIAWVLSEHDAPLSFCECCDALGFDPVEARTQIRIPATAYRAIA